MSSDDGLEEDEPRGEPSGCAVPPNESGRESSSLSGHNDSTSSQLDIADSISAETIAALESGGESAMLDAVAMESDGDESIDGDGNDAPLIKL